MACWTIVFANILAAHEDEYIAQRGDDKARAQIIKNCLSAILDTPQAAHPSVPLPDNFRLVSTLMHHSSYLVLN